jgi:ATP-binding cassette, subfamily F, member 3
MSLVIAEGLSHEFGAQVIYKGVSFRIADGDRIGMVGPNGEGKTTLLRTIAGELEATLGDLHRRRNLSIGYLPQDPPAFTDTTIEEAMLEVFADLRDREKQLDELEQRVAGGGEQELERYGAAQAEFEHAGGYSYRRRIEQVLGGMKFPRDMWNRPLCELSGGERTRAYFSQLLLAEPEVLLLDEPTNHLDIDSVEWLERWLDSFNGAVVAVSHDRYFLDRVTKRTWEVASGGMEAYPGAYSKYVHVRAERHKARMSLWEEQQEYIARTEDFIRRYHASQRTKEAQGRKAHLEKFLEREAIAKPGFTDTIHLRLPQPERTGDFVLRSRGLSVGFDEPLLASGELEVMRGQKIAIVGPNGSGKTTLLRCLLGQLPALSGEARLGAKVKFGYLSQTHVELDPDLDAVDNVRAADPSMKPQEVRRLLGSLLLSGDEALKKVGALSGGQRSRVILARLAVQRVNVLALDEPTNHLDIPSTEIIQEALKAFEGTVFLVSHDRYLVQAVATHLWVIGNGQLHKMRGGWQDYLAWREQGSGSGGQSNGSKGEGSGDFRKARKHATRQASLRRKLERLEKEVGRAEAELAELNSRITAAGEAGRLDEVESLGTAYAAKEAALKELWSSWEEVGSELE